jgi:hypothetical protein
VLCGQTETDAYQYTEYMNDPELLRKVWGQAADFVTAKFVDSIE